MNVTAIGLQGLDRAAAGVDAAARKIESSDSTGVDTVDLSVAAVGFLAAKHAYEANLSVLKTGQELDKHLLDVLA